MQDLVSNITVILSAILGWFTTIISFILSTPILALPVFIGLVLVLIGFVVHFISSFFGNKNKD